MDLLQCIRERRSVRKYEETPISHEIIEEIIEVAAYAPSWKHSQIVRYVLVENREIIDKIADEMILDFKMNRTTMNSCPAIMLVTYITNRSGFERDGTFSTPKGDRFEMFDAGIASQTFCLLAHEKGIGTVITGYFNEEKIAELLEFPQNQKIGAIICMGYPSETPNTPKRKTVTDLLSYK